MRNWMAAALASGTLFSAGGAEAATMAYWNLFNVEGEGTLSAAFATYATLTDMLNDENRTGSVEADGFGSFGANIVGTGSDGSSYWNLFNVEGEGTLSAAFATYATLTDMLNDENRTGSVEADGFGSFGANIVGTGSDGSSYWNLFNVEGEGTLSAAFATYATLTDMLNDENRTGSVEADGFGSFGANIVGTGSDGSSYWNLFNVEGEGTLSAAFATYATLTDMLNDENRTGSVEADGFGSFGANIVGTGALIVRDPDPAPIPLPTTSLLLGGGLVALARLRRRSTGLSTRCRPRPDAA